MLFLGGLSFEFILTQVYLGFEGLNLLNCGYSSMRRRGHMGFDRLR